MFGGDLTTRSWFTLNEPAFLVPLVIHFVIAHFRIELNFVGFFTPGNRKAFLGELAQGRQIA